MKKTYIAIVLAIAAASPLAAQNLNPEVQVTNDYVARMADVHKNGTPMSVPDSLTRFSTDIDYSVFTTAYQGAYEFSPYSIVVEPEARAYEGSTLYLRAGAGYTFHPVVRAVYTPFPKGLVRNSEYLSFDGYGGRYRSMDGRAAYDGHDYDLGAGALIRWNKEKFDLSADAGYDGIYTADDALSSVYHKAKLGVNLHSNTDDIPVTYNMDAAFHYGSDAVSTLGSTGEFGYKIHGFVCPEIGRSFKLRVDIHSQGSWFAGGAISPAILNSAAPKLVYEVGDFTFAAGGKIALSEEFSVHPDISAQWLASGGVIAVRASLGGGQILGDYTTYKTADHWFNTSYLTKFVPTVEKLNAALEIRGLVFKHLQYNLSGGWRKLSNGALQGLDVVAAAYVPGIKYVDYEQAWGNLLLNWKSERFELNMDATYAYNMLAKGADYLTPAAFTMESSAVYNWNRRIFAGMRCKAMSARESTQVNLPGFADLGLYGEYVFGSRLSAWAQFGNLLDQQLSYSPTHIAGGLNFTLGVCLKLQ